MEDEESDALEAIGQAMSSDELGTLGDQMTQARQRLMVWNLAPAL